MDAPNTITFKDGSIDDEKRAPQWRSISKKFTYRHPVNDEVMEMEFSVAGPTYEEAVALMTFTVDEFMTDRGDSIVEYLGFGVWPLSMIGAIRS